MGAKRKDYISWDEYFMGVAILSGLRSKDPNTQVGCCIVSQDNKILSMGYNGLPTGCSDDEFPWVREGDDPLETKYVYTVHSELNAILNYRAEAWRGQSFMYLSFPVMNVRKPLFRAGSRRSFTTAINTKTLLPCRHPCGCSMRQASIIINTTARSGRSRSGCRCG